MPRAATTSDTFNAIAEPRRRDILDYLAVRERSVGDIVIALNLPQPSVSKHLGVLRDVGLVDVRRDGRQALYRTNAERFVRSTSGPASSSATGRVSWGASSSGPSATSAGPRLRRSHDCSCFRTRSADARPHRGNSRARADRQGVCRPARGARAVEPRTPGRTDADDARGVARRPLVPRPRQRQRAPVGPRAGHQSARRCSRSPGR